MTTDPLGDTDSLQGTTVLYVEDDPDIREQLAQYLRRRVGTLHVAVDGREGLEAARHYRPDIVVTDIMMPVMDGLKMAEAIRAENPGVPIIVTSAFNETGFLLKAIDLGIDKYVIKPIDTNLLLRAMRQSARAARTELAMQLAATVFGASSNAIVITDAAQRIISVNAAFREITGYTTQEVVGRTPALLKSGLQDAAFYRDMWEALIAHGHWSGEIWNRRKDGAVYAEWLTINAVKGYGSNVTHYVAVFADITEHKRAQERVHHLAHYDALTDLPNRVLFGDRLTQALLQAQRHGGKAAVMFLDLDRFKVINDTLGHGVGDALLREVAERLKTCVRQGDTVSRLGGDEFVVLLPAVATTDDAALIAARLLTAVARPFLLEGRELGIGVSIGITLYPNDGSDAATLMKNADVAMYRAKELGRNNFQFYYADMNAPSIERLALETSLRQALERGQLELHYQPRYRLPERRIVGVEALIRWRHPEHGLLRPAHFIRLAEETGLILPIGEWVLRTATAQAVTWDKAGLPPLFLAVNISARQLRQSDFPCTVERILRESGFDPHRLELELTESTLMADTEENVATLRRLKELGIRIAIDDFGTGYSSLAYLKRLPVDIIKIDQSFIREAPTRREDAAIVEAIVAMARTLALHVIAEGAETDDQSRFLQQRNCAEVQGYHFSRPLPAEQFARLLAANGDPVIPDGEAKST